MYSVRRRRCLHARRAHAPKALRDRLGLKRGSRIRFRFDDRGRLQADPVLYELEDLWAISDAARPLRRAMPVHEMDAAKARRRW